MKTELSLAGSSKGRLALRRMPRLRSNELDVVVMLKLLEEEENLQSIDG